MVRRQHADLIWECLYTKKEAEVSLPRGGRVTVRKAASHEDRCFFLAELQQTRAINVIFSAGLWCWIRNVKS